MAVLNKKKMASVDTETFPIFTFYFLTAFWKLQPISVWNQKWERKRCPHILSSVFGMNSVLTSKTSGRRKTNLFFKKGTFVCLFKGFSQRMLLGAITQKPVSLTSLAHNLLNTFWSFLSLSFFPHSLPLPPSSPPIRFFFFGHDFRMDH